MITYRAHQVPACVQHAKKDGLSYLVVQDDDSLVHIGTKHDLHEPTQ
jgi:hypothetical protein